MVISERVIEIAQKVREIHGEHDFRMGQEFYSGPGSPYVFLEEPDEDVSDEWLWLPSSMDYMRMLWVISVRYIMTVGAEVWKLNSGVVGWACGATITMGAMTKIANSPAEAWWNVVSE